MSEAGTSTSLPIKKSGDVGVPIWALLAGVLAIYLAQTNRLQPSMLFTGGSYLKDGWANSLLVGGALTILFGGIAGYMRSVGHTYRPWVIVAGLLAVVMTLFDTITLLVLSAAGA